MNDIKKAFENGKALIPFITAGDPSLAVTEQLLIEMSKNGADIIAIGIPFSDPIAEGVAIQEADLRALAAGTTTDKIFEMVKGVRPQVACELAVMTYMNPVFVYGVDKFMERCAECGISAVIVPDTPYEEKAELSGACISSPGRPSTSTATRTAVRQFRGWSSGTRPCKARFRRTVSA